MELIPLLLTAWICCSSFELVLALRKEENKDINTIYFRNSNLHKVDHDDVVAALNEKIVETNSHVYFLVSPGPRWQSLKLFIREFGIEKQHMSVIVAFDRDNIAKRQRSVLRYLVYRRKMITTQWVRRYITGVDDPNSRIKNLGRLALAMTFDKAMQLFLDSKYENFIVFEDDVVMNPKLNNVRRLFAGMLSIPKPKWDIQYLGFCFECGNQNRNRNQKSAMATSSWGVFEEAVFPLCTHAIMFSRAAATLIMNTYTPFVNNKGDWILHILACQFGLKVIRPLEPLFLQNVTSFGVDRDSRLGNANDKRAFAHWVKCDKEKQRCQAMRRNHSGVESGELFTKQLHQRGIPPSYIP